nr:hypothetical protein Itr_chr06CG23060 [Ipomoea trifida]
MSRCITILLKWKQKGISWWKELQLPAAATWDDLSICCLRLLLFHNTGHNTGDDSVAHGYFTLYYVAVETE